MSRTPMEDDDHIGRWVASGADEAPRYAIDAALREVDDVGQRPAWVTTLAGWPATARVGVAVLGVAALLLVGVVAYTQFTGTNIGTQTPMRNCGGTPDELCSRIVDAAVRQVPPGSTLVAVDVEPYFARGDFACPTGGCPSVGSDLQSGAELRFADRRPLQLNCFAIFAVSERAFGRDLMACVPLDEGDRRRINLYTSVENWSNVDVILYTLSGSGSGGSLATGQGAPLPSGRGPQSCGFESTGAPLTMLIGEAGPRGEAISEPREVWRSEQIGNPEGDVFLRIVIEAPDRVRVEQLDSAPC